MIIEELDFTVRTYHALKRAGINTIEQLEQMTDDDLFRLRNIGVRCVSEIRSKLPYIPPTMTIAEKIRSMSDKELAVFWSNNYDNFCQNKPECGAIIDTEDCIPGEWCVACALEWLRQPAEEIPRPVRIHEDKEESGLLEEY